MPSHIIYVSCNLATLARDLDALSDQYAVTSITGIDMFPQTEYIESVVTLVPRATL
jgi:23S rRNA (uracil1939-C5)-methyltransferase